jgi:DNA-binding NarL/FixJ family response regulator
VTRVVIADDQAMVRSGLRVILELAGREVVAEAGDGAEAVSAVLEHSPDVVLMDIRMPGTDGIEATRRLVAADSPARVVNLTTFDIDQHVFDALAAGAAGFLVKDATAEQLVAAVERTAAGETPMAPSVLARLVDRYLERDPAPPLPSAGSLDLLSPREREVLALSGAGLTNPEIADHLFLSMATVKTHVRNILTNLDARDLVQAVLVANLAGLVADVRRG